jgi:hypothetical protein
MAVARVKGPLIRMVNKAGRVMLVNPDQIDEKKKVGYKVSDDAVDTAPVTETESDETTVTAKDLTVFTVNDLKEFCEEMEIEFKAGWNKADFVDALLESGFVPPAEED